MKTWPPIKMHGQPYKWWWHWLVWVGLGLVWVGCGTAAPTHTPPASPPPLPTAAPLPTLYPTYTPVRPQITPPPTLLPPTLAPTATAVDFSQPIIIFTYQIPAIGLNRRFEGSLNSDVRLLDLTAATSLTLRGQQRAMVQLQSILPGLELSPLPANCDGRCVQFSYELPPTGETGTGWLENDILLASIEQFFSTNLGPHFPDGTVVGLHRTASAYAVAHTSAILADGTLWQWQATEAEIGAPTAAPPAIALTTADLPLSRLETSYTAPCEGFPTETLLIETTAITVQCPALSLPIPLVSFYQTLDALSTAMLEQEPERNRPWPAPRLPLTAVLYYQRADGANLTLYPDGQLTAVSATGTISTTQLEASTVLSTTNALITSGVIGRAVVLASAETVAVPSLLIVRGDLGVYEFGWSDTIGQSLLPPVLELDQWLNQQLAISN